MRTIDTRRAWVLGVDNGVATMIDRSTGITFDITQEPTGGVFPVSGDMWKCVRDERGWHFDSCLRLREPRRERTFREVLESLADRGLVFPMFATEAPHLAFIGEVRLFAVDPGSDWVPCSDDDVLILDRARYPELGRAIDPGDTTTFTIPSVTVTSDPVGAVKPYICAR